MLKHGLLRNVAEWSLELESSIGLDLIEIRKMVITNSDTGSDIVKCHSRQTFATFCSLIDKLSHYIHKSDPLVTSKRSVRE